MLSLYTIYKFTYSQNRLRRNVFGRLYILYTVIFVLSLVVHVIHSHIHAYAIFQNSPQCTNQHHTSCKNTVCSLFCSSLHTHGNDVSLLRANAGNASLPVDLFGIQMDSVSLKIHHLQSHFVHGIL